MFFCLQFIFAKDLTSATFDIICNNADSDFTIVETVTTSLTSCNIHNGVLHGANFELTFSEARLFDSVENFTFYDVRIVFNWNSQQSFSFNLSNVQLNNCSLINISQLSNNSVNTLLNLTSLSQLPNAVSYLFENLSSLQVLSSRLNVSNNLCKRQVQGVLVNNSQIQYLFRRIPFLGNLPVNAQLFDSSVLCLVSLLNDSLSCVANGSVNLSFEKLFVQISAKMVKSKPSVFLIDEFSSAIPRELQFAVISSSLKAPNIMELFNKSIKVCVECAPPQVPNEDHSQCILKCDEFFVPNEDNTGCVLNCDGFFAPNATNDGCELRCPPMFIESIGTCACVSNAICSNDAFARCQDGFYQKDEACVACLANAACIGGVLICDSGYYLKDGVCTACQVANSVCNADGTFKECQPGFVPNAGNTACVAQADCSLEGPFFKPDGLGGCVLDCSISGPYFTPNDNGTGCVLDCSLAGKFYIFNENNNGCVIKCPPMFNQIPNDCQCVQHGVCNDTNFLRCKDGYYQSTSATCICTNDSKEKDCLIAKDSNLVALITGIVSGVVVLLAIIIIVLVICLMKMKKEKSELKNQTLLGANGLEGSPPNIGVSKYTDATPSVHQQLQGSSNKQDNLSRDMNDLSSRPTSQQSNLIGNEEIGGTVVVPKTGDAGVPKPKKQHRKLRKGSGTNGSNTAIQSQSIQLASEEVRQGKNASLNPAKQPTQLKPIRFQEEYQEASDGTKTRKRNAPSGLSKDQPLGGEEKFEAELNGK